MKQYATIQSAGAEANRDFVIHRYMIFGSFAAPALGK
jgi:hypothetical protein